jgi:hypothetical protein
MSLDRAKLMDFLSLVGAEVRRKITLVAAGGTALTLLDVKPSTIDLDLTGPARISPSSSEPCAGSLTGSRSMHGRTGWCSVSCCWRIISREVWRSDT